MCSKKNTELDELAKWFELLCADPFTNNLLDENFFRVDVFETEKLYIIEADLPQYSSDQIKVKCQDNAAIIQAYEDDHKYKERVVYLPFNLADKDVCAYFDKDILEVHISKEDVDQCETNVRNIKINDKE
jgi:HSP20 family molecular chaperone IbpA